MSAIRLARGFTGRDLVVKFAGCYHGHVDALLASAGSGLATLAVPGTPGVPASAAGETIVLPYNDRAAVEQAFAEHGDRIACLITEATPGNMGIVPPEPGFNAFLAETCRRHGALFVSDEVMTGFRATRQGGWGLDGAVEGWTPDLMTFGKVMGGGFPAAAFGGRADVMGRLAPDGPVYQAGTLSGNPVATTAGPRHAAPGHRRGLRPARRDRRDHRLRGRRRAGRRRGAPPPAVGRHDVLDLLRRRRGPRLRRRQPAGHRGVRGVLPCHARRRGLPAPVGVRGVVRVRPPTTTAPCRPSWTPCRPPPVRRRRGHPHPTGKETAPDGDDRPPAPPRRGPQPRGRPLRPPRRVPPLRPRHPHGPAHRRDHR